MKKLILGLAIAMMSVMSSKASHFVGGDIGYTCLGGNQYEFYFYFYEDCAGFASAPTSMSLSGTSSCGTISIPMIQIDLNPSEPLENGYIDTTGLCDSYLSSCNGGSYPGTKIYKLVSAPITVNSCSDWSFCYNSCCRNAAGTFNFPPYNVANGGNKNYTGDGYAFLLTMNNADGTCDDSPLWNLPPRAYVCQEIETYMDNGATDPDGDSLVYQLVDVATDCGGGTVSYNSPFSANYPISTTTGTFPFDQTTGVSIFTPSFLPGVYEVSVIGVLLSSYRDGILKGTTLRDMQIVTLHDCEPLDAFSASPDVKGAVKTSDSSMYICAGDTLIFDIAVFDDINPGGFDLVSNIKKKLPNAEFIVIDTIPHPNGIGSMAIGTIILPTTNDDVGIYTFNVTAKNNGCPIEVTELFKFAIDIKPNTFVIATPDTTCYGLKDSVHLIAEGGDHFTWFVKDGEGDDKIFCDTCALAYAYPKETTTYRVLSDLGQFGCGYEDSVTITVVPRIDILGDLEVCFEDTSILELGWDWTPSIGVSYIWNEDDNFTDTFMYAFTEGTFILMVSDTVDVTDSLFCTFSDTVQMVVVDCPPIVPNIITPNGDGFNDVFFIQNIRRQVWNLKVYSRWGRELIVEKRDYENDFNGEGLADGIYYYYLTNQEGAVITEMKGWFQITR